MRPVRAMTVGADISPSVFLFPRGPSGFNTIVTLARTFLSDHCFTDLMLGTFYYSVVIVPSCMSEDKTQEPEIYSESYPVLHNEAAGSMLGNKCEE
jgi:hypothetical protein